MANDLEDFLKRAAARRQAAQQQKRQTDSPNMATPQSHSPVRDERRIRVPPEDVEPVLQAELIDVVEPVLNRDQKSALERARSAAKRASDYKASSSIQTERTKAAAPAIEMVDTHTGSPEVDALLKAMRNPIGFRQAILIHEILDRPTHRW